MNKFPLPLGSIVLLKNGDKKALIYGRNVMLRVDQQQTFDYAACPYPVGYLNDANTHVFNHEDIKEVFFVGFVDDEEKEYAEALRHIDNAPQSHANTTEEAGRIWNA